MTYMYHSVNDYVPRKARESTHFETLQHALLYSTYLCSDIITMDGNTYFFCNNSHHDPPLRCMYHYYYIVMTLDTSVELARGHVCPIPAPPAGCHTAWWVSRSLQQCTSSAPKNAIIIYYGATAPNHDVPTTHHQGPSSPVRLCHVPEPLH